MQLMICEILPMYYRCTCKLLFCILGQMVGVLCASIIWRCSRPVRTNSFLIDFLTSRSKLPLAKYNELLFLQPNFLMCFGLATSTLFLPHIFRVRTYRNFLARAVD